MILSALYFFLLFLLLFRFFHYFSIHLDTREAFELVHATRRYSTSTVSQALLGSTENCANKKTLKTYRGRQKGGLCIHDICLYIFSFTKTQASGVGSTNKAFCIWKGWNLSFEKGGGCGDACMNEKCTDAKHFSIT